MSVFQCPRIDTHQPLTEWNADRSTRQGVYCSQCGREINHFHGYDRPIQLRHLPILERQVYLEIRPKRYRCPHCEGRPTTTQRYNWYDPNSPSTQAFEK